MRTKLSQCGPETKKSEFPDNENSQKPGGECYDVRACVEYNKNVCIYNGDDY